MTIQWFPGHMAKARRQIMEKIKLVDVVIELLDARLPLSSRNPMVNEIVGDKPRVILLNKHDLADEKATASWVEYFQEQGIAAIPMNAVAGAGQQQLIAQCKEIMKEKFDRFRAKGANPRAIRALIIGIPNVGKSSLINRLAKKNIAQTGDRPGVTKSQQWIKVGTELELLDTPGILWPKFEDQRVGLRLAASGAIKDELLHYDDIALFTIKHLMKHYSDRLKDRYGLDTIAENPIEVIEEIGRRRGCLVTGGLVDFSKAAELITRELRSGKLGRISLEVPGDWQEEQ